MCWRCGVVSRNKVCVFFHRVINNFPGMSGLPASREGLVLASQGLPVAIVSGHGAHSEPACWGRGHYQLPWPLLLVAFPCGQAVLCSALGQSLPSLPEGAFSASPSKVLAKGFVCLEQAGAHLDRIPAVPRSRRAGDRRSRASITSGSSPWALGSAQGEKSTP